MPVNTNQMRGPLQSLIPIRFPGGFYIEEMSDDCSSCKADVPMSHWTAEGTWLGGNALVMTMDATCPACGAAQHRHLRLRGNEDGTGQIETPTEGGGWSNYQVLQPTWWDSFVSTVKRLF